MSEKMYDKIEKMLKGRFLNKFKIVKHYYNNQKPVTLEVHPSSLCNYKCVHCIDNYLKSVPNDTEYQINRDSKSLMTRKNMDDIIKGCEELNIKGIILSGGEPTLNKETEYLIEEATDRGIMMGMLTNGSLLNDINIPIYIRNLSFIRFSLDDYSHINYAKTKRVPEGMYHKVLYNIKKCTDWKNKNPETKCKIGVGFIITPDNINKMVGIYLKTIDLKVDYLQFCDCVEYGYQFTESMKNKIVNNLENILAFQDYSLNGVKVVYEPLQVSNDIYCKDCEMIDYFALISADGQVQPCPHTARHFELSYGSINVESLKEIWENRPKRLQTRYFWEHCRFREQNRILKALKNVEHGDLL